MKLNLFLVFIKNKFRMIRIKIEVLECVCGFCVP
jgi:hypothetical protein